MKKHSNHVRCVTLLYILKWAAGMRRCEFAYLPGHKMRQPPRGVKYERWNRPAGERTEKPQSNSGNRGTAADTHLGQTKNQSSNTQQPPSSRTKQSRWQLPGVALSDRTLVYCDRVRSINERGWKSYRPIPWVVCACPRAEATCTRRGSSRRSYADEPNMRTTKRRTRSSMSTFTSLE